MLQTFSWNIVKIAVFVHITLRKTLGIRIDVHPCKCLDILLLHHRQLITLLHRRTTQQQTCTCRFSFRYYFSIACWGSIKSVVTQLSHEWSSNECSFNWKEVKLRRVQKKNHSRKIYKIIFKSPLGFLQTQVKVHLVGVLFLRICTSSSQSKFTIVAPLSGCTRKYFARIHFSQKTYGAKNVLQN